MTDLKEAAIALIKMLEINKYCGTTTTMDVENTKEFKVLKQALSELDNIQQQLESQELVEKMAESICKSPGGDWKWINSYEKQDETGTSNSDWHKKHAQAAVEVISNQLKGGVNDR